MKSLDGRNVVSPQRSPSDDVARETLPTGTIVGRYRVIALLASGGMGDVYRAHDEGLGRDVALKVLPAELTNDTDRVQRFAQEARSASALNHPHIVAIYEIGHARPSRTVRSFAKERDPKRRDVHYIAMELIEGETLREYMRGSVPLRRRIELLTQIAEGLGKAHAAGIVHRDLKPDNIMVSHEGYAKVVDFGLAKLIEPTRGWNPIGADSPTMRALTQQGELIGTAGYMSPEQIAGKPVDQRSDIFSFGCIAYEIIGGTRPFDGESFVDTLHQILHNNPPSVPNATAELQRIVGRCLVKDREERYQSIRDIAIELRDVLRQLDSGSSEPIVLSALASNARRLPTTIFAVVACVIAAIALIFGLRTKPTAAPPPAVVAAPAEEPAAEIAMRRLTNSGRVTHATISRDGRYIAYVTHNEKGASVILQQVATGSSITIVPPLETSHYAGLSFTPDSNHIIFTRYDASVFAAIYELPILGGTPAKIVDDADTVPAISPDGRQIAFARDDFNLSSSVVMIVSRDGSNLRRVGKWALPNRVLSPAWSPDGKTIVVVRASELFAISLPSNQVTSVPLGGWRGVLRGVSWSADGNSLIVSGASEHASGNMQLMRVAWPSGTVTPLTNDSDDYAEPVGATSPAISAVQVKRESNVWSVGLDGTSKQLTRGLASSAGMGGATWTADGRIVYSSAASGTFDIWLQDPSTGVAVPLTRDTTAEYRPTVLPDGKTVLYVARTASAGSIWRINLDGTNKQQLTNGGDDYEYALSPDHKRIIYATLDAKSSRYLIRSVGIDGGASTTLAAGGAVLKDLEVAPDGEIVFTAYEDTALRVFKVPAAGGAMQRLTPGKAGGAVVSPDGTQVALSYEWDDYMKTKLAIVPLAGGAPSKVFPLGGWRYRWMPDGKSIVYTLPAGTTENVFVQSVAGGAPRQLTSFQDGSIANFDIGPKGTLLVTHYVEATDVVALAAKY
jgi:serine/threonine protein kinase/Tol biopolymer transport system component